MDRSSHPYDLFVIGSGPGGQRAAIQAAKMGKRVGLAEQMGVLGGVCINTGTIPSKTLREAILQVAGPRTLALGWATTQPARDVTMADLRRRVNQVIENEIEVSRQQLRRNGVELHWARASFIGPQSLRLEPGDGGPSRSVEAHRIVIATGTTTTVDPRIPLDGRTVLTSDDILGISEIPRTLVVVGAGVIGLEYASMFATLGVRVTVIDKRRELLSFLDSEIVDALAYQLRRNRVTLRLGEEVSGIEKFAGDHGERVRIHLASGKQVITETALYSVGRTGSTWGLGLEAAGLAADERGRIPVDEHHQTATPGIYAVGDVIGFPALASTSMAQGRLAAAHAFGVQAAVMPAVLPYGLFTVPEISMVGRTEEQLTEEGVPYEVGTAQYREIARGQIVGDLNGMLKLIFHLETRELLGVHVIGEGAAELVHIGQAVMAFGGGADYFVDTVFNYPTLAECYKTAAFDAINRMSELGPMAGREERAA